MTGTSTGEIIAAGLAASGRRRPRRLEAYQQSLDISRDLAARDPDNLAACDPDNTEWQRDLIVSLVNLAEAVPEEAIASYEEALRIAETLQQSGRMAPTDEWLLANWRAAWRPLSGSSRSRFRATGAEP